jgi:putative hemolysin
MVNNGGMALHILIFIALLVAYLVCLAGAVAVSRSRTNRLRERASQGRLASTYGRLVLVRAERHYMTAQLLCLISGMLLALLALNLADQASAKILGYLNPDHKRVIPEWLIEGGVLVLIVTSIALLTTVLSQSVKVLVTYDPEHILCSLARLIIFTSAIFLPVVKLIEGISTNLVTFFQPEARSINQLRFSSEELNSLVEQTGELEEEQKEIIQSVFSFTDTRVREVMTSRAEVVAIAEHEATLEEVRKIFEKEGFSRILVYGENLDQIKGLIFMKDLVSFVGREGSDFSLQKMLRPAYFVPSSKKVSELLEEFQRSALHFAVVLDEHGAVDGVVTIEDLLEELVGEINDEFDKPGETAQLRKTKSGDLLVTGGVLISEINQRSGLNIPEGEYDTIAGFVMHLIGRMPSIGEIVERDNLKFRIEAIAQKRITLIRIVHQKRKVIASPVVAQPLRI